MVALRKRAYALYPLLNVSDNKYASEAVKRLDKALNSAKGILDREDSKANELMKACDFAQTILG